jgi:hypothetical protein
MIERGRAKEIVRRKIELDHSLGESVGGSGHLGYTSIANIEIKNIIRKDDAASVYWEITYEYVLETTTEFTVYPDNPPYRSTYRKIVRTDSEGNIQRMDSHGEQG